MGETHSLKPRIQMCFSDAPHFLAFCLSACSRQAVLAKVCVFVQILCDAGRTGLGDQRFIRGCL